jgi:hypothetical protein
VIEREVLLRPGKVWNREVVDETQRKLKDGLFTSLVVLVPVRVQGADSQSDSVDLLVVTRDIWSLRMNSSFEVQQGKLTALQLSIAENNIFGLRKHSAVVFDMVQSSFTIGPQYLDRALGGSRLHLTSRLNAIYSREGTDFEGTSSTTSINYPLWSLRRKWGGGVRLSHFDSTIRAFRGIDIELVDNPNTPEVEQVPFVYKRKALNLDSSVVRSFGHKVKQHLTFGHTLSVLRPSAPDGFSGSPADLRTLEEVVFPRSERASAVFARYRVFTPEYKTYRNFNSYDLAEDIKLGPDFSVAASSALRAIGSESNFYQASMTASWTFSLLGDGFVVGSTGGATRLQDSHFIDNSLSTNFKLASPRIANAFRVVARTHVGLRYRERGNARYTLGGSNGLRGYQISEFSGQKRVLTNLEFRSMPIRVLFARFGAVAFWDMGHAANRLEELRMKHGVGFGIRYLVPQLQPIVFRLDWAFPLQGPSAGFPGRLSAGVAQVF